MVGVSKRKKKSPHLDATMHARHCSGPCLISTGGFKNGSSLIFPVCKRRALQTEARQGRKHRRRSASHRHHSHTLLHTRAPKTQTRNTLAAHQEACSVYIYIYKYIMHTMDLVGSKNYVQFLSVCVVDVETNILPAYPCFPPQQKDTRHFIMCLLKCFFVCAAASLFTPV